jgi:hypothetical protein
MQALAAMCTGHGCSSSRRHTPATTVCWPTPLTPTPATLATRPAHSCATAHTMIALVDTQTTAGMLSSATPSGTHMCVNYNRAPCLVPHLLPAPGWPRFQRIGRHHPQRERAQSPPPPYLESPPLHCSALHLLRKARSSLCCLVRSSPRHQDHCRHCLQSQHPSTHHLNLLAV